MKLDVDKLTTGAQPFAHTFAAGELSLDDGDEARLLPGAVVEGIADRRGDEVRLRGKISARVETHCDRCARGIGVPVEVEFDAPYAPRAAATTVENLELNQPDLDLSFYEGDAIDVDELVREQVLLALPSRSLCREECQGLCAICGADLNDERCACAPGEIDPRWAALADFKRNQSSES